MRIHCCVGFYALLAGLVTGISVPEWAAVLLCVGLVPALELVNTALERLCDRVTGQDSPLIRAAKDCAAGAVLWAALSSAVLGCAVFFSGGRPEKALSFALAHPAAAALICLTLPVWLIFVFRKSPQEKSGTKNHSAPKGRWRDYHD